MEKYLSQYGEESGRKEKVIMYKGHHLYANKRACPERIVKKNLAWLEQGEICSK